MCLVAHLWFVVKFIWENTKMLFFIYERIPSDFPLLDDGLPCSGINLRYIQFRIQMCRFSDP
jgi:hypothetical protein